VPNIFEKTEITAIVKKTITLITIS